jgi:hypothetical protein
MKEINFNFNFKDLSNKVIPGDDSNAGKLISNLLAADTGKNPIKFFTWAQLFYAGQTVKLDNQDLELLKTFITDSTSITALAKAQILEVLNASK